MEAAHKEEPLSARPSVGPAGRPLGERGQGRPGPGRAGTLGGLDGFAHRSKEPLGP